MVNYTAYKSFFVHDELDIEYEKISHNINNVTDVSAALEIIFQYHRKKGFPHYTILDQDKVHSMKSLREFNEKELFKGNYIDQSMHSLGLAWSYFPHWVEVQCGNSKMRPIDFWNDDKKLKEIIRKTWNWHKNHSDGKFTLNRIRQNFKIYAGNQTVSNFRPSAAKWIYNTYGGDTIWDMSCGWGGRLIGFLTSNARKYIGTDPSEKTYDGLLQMKSELNFWGKEIELHKIGSENFIPDKESIDLCFTSPPYFDTEKYSMEETQSFKKFPSEYLWINGFLRKTIENCFIGLKSDGKLMLNIANTPKYKTIETETIKVAEDVGFSHIDTIYLALSSVSGKGMKLEPIFIFNKKTKEKSFSFFC